MQGTGKSYEYSGNTTEWDDILIKKGITTKEEVLLSKGLNPLNFVKDEEPEVEEVVRDKYEDLDLDELDALEEEDLNTDSKALEHYRHLRLQQLKEAAIKNRFGEVEEITKDEWVRQVTEASEGCDVVVHLYEDSMIECQIMDDALRSLASRFKYIKFLRIKYNQAIENWPERNLPTVFVYSKGSLKTQIVTLNNLGGKQTKPANVEWFLARNGVITDSDLEENPSMVMEKPSVRKLVGGSRLRGYDSDSDSRNSDEY